MKENSEVGHNWSVVGSTFELWIIVQHDIALQSNFSFSFVDSE